MDARALVALAFALLVFACTSDDAPRDRGPATKIDPATTGIVHGVVLYEGSPPAAKMLKPSGDAACASAHPGPVPAGDVVVHDGKVENAFVYVHSGLERYVFEVPKEPVVVDQKGCVYVNPNTGGHVFGARAGQEIRFLNSDPTLHNVHTKPEKSRGVNFGMGVQGSKRSIRIEEPEVMVDVRCDVHPWMLAYIGVVDHPFFALSGKNGTFRIEGIPAGKYKLEVWHERFGQKIHDVTIDPQKAAEVKFAFP